MRRRRALQVLGGCTIGALAGCTAGRRGFATYHYESDAPIEGWPVGPWLTLASDARRSGHLDRGLPPRMPALEVFDYPRRPIAMEPAFVNGIAYFGARQPAPEHSGRFGPSGLKATDGRNPEWFIPQPRSLASPTVAGNAIFVTSEGLTLALDRRDGTRCWAYHEGRGDWSASPTVVDDTVYVTGGRVFALAATTGEVQWAAARPGVRLRGTAATEDGVYATAGHDGRGRIYRYDLETGRDRWATSTNSDVLFPPIVGEFVYVVTGDGRLLALDGSDGSEAWSRDLGGQAVAMPALAEGTVFAVPASGDALTAFDANTGDPQWDFPVGAQRAIGLTIGDDIAFLSAETQTGGIIYGIDAESGRRRGSLALPQTPVTRIVLGYGEALIGTGTSASRTRLYRLRAQTEDEQS